MANPEKFDLAENWLGMVAYSHSGSNNTRENYRRNWNRFLSFAGRSAEDIMKEYEGSTDRDFKRRYAQIVKSWIAQLSQEGLSNSSIKVTVAAVQSFFKYHDLPLGFIPVAKDIIEFHNRDIAKEEIQVILRASLPRDRAFYAVMAQSGIRPDTLCHLKLKHIEQSEELPWKITVPQKDAKGKFGAHFTFIGEDAVRHLKAYWAMRRNLTPESYVFSQLAAEKPVKRALMSMQFSRTVRHLKDTGHLQFEIKEKGKPAEIRLYSLRKFFRKMAGNAGIDYVEFWMGHRQGVIDHYISREPEHHRQLYKEKAMPFLRLEEPTPTETEQTIKELRKDLAEKEKMLKILQPLIEFAQSNPNALENFLSVLSVGELEILKKFKKKGVEKQNE